MEVRQDTGVVRLQFVQELVHQAKGQMVTEERSGWDGRSGVFCQNGHVPAEERQQDGGLECGKVEHSDGTIDDLAVNGDLDQCGGVAARE